MKFEECYNILKEEKDNKTTSRFPCRVILINCYDTYLNVVKKLSTLCDRTISIDDLFSGPDVMPAYDDILEKMKMSEWLLLPGVGEYLRLFYKSELRSKRFTRLWHGMVDATSTGRVIIPLWNCDALWHDKTLQLQSDERQNDFVYTIDDEIKPPQKLNILVLSSVFEGYIDKLNSKFTLHVGLREWYDWLINMHNLDRLSNYCLLTKHARLIDSVIGDISIRVINDKYTFVRENLVDGQRLTQDNCTDEILDELFEEALKGTSINKAILNRFNVVCFDGLSIMSSWNIMPKGKRQLLKLWYQLNPDHSYLCHCMVNSTLQDIEKYILLDIFDTMTLHPNWVQESQQLMFALKLKKTDEFFTKLDTIPVYEDKLSFLSADTKEERIYILRMVGQWLKQDVTQVRTSDMLKKLYPALFEYLQSMPENIEPIYNDYILDYKIYKLSNTLPESEESYFRGINPETLPYRFKLLQQNIKSDTVILWIDAMGFEYLSLLTWVLGKNPNGKVVYVALAQATLPTETKFNMQWHQMGIPYKKLDKLDKLAHKGVVDEPDYYVCIEEQLTFIESIAAVVNELLKSYQRIIITGDHGTSRLAARFFHERKGLTPPKDTLVRSHGRYCQIHTEPTVIYDTLKSVKDSDNNRYLIFSSYDHFSIGGFVTGGDDENAIYGEIHGGATPEEIVVPVIVFDRNTSLPLTAKWLNDKNIVVLKKKAIKVGLQFNRSVSSLQVKIGGYDASCQRENDMLWVIRVEGIAAGTYNAVIVADGQLLAINQPLIVKPALGGGDGDL